MILYQSIQEIYNWHHTLEDVGYTCTNEEVIH